MKPLKEFIGENPQCGTYMDKDFNVYKICVKRSNGQVDIAAFLRKEGDYAARRVPYFSVKDKLVRKIEEFGGVL